MEQTIKRDRYLKALADRRENGLIKVITGIRRCGKSYLLFRIYRDWLMEQGVREDHIITVALDDDLNVEYRDPDALSRYIRSQITDQDEMFYLFIDEVQYAISKEELKNPEAIRLYNVLNGLLRLRNVDIYVTGSNSKMLSRDVMTAFRGRGDTVEVYPLSFQEFYSAVGGDKTEAYEEYALYGGMPLVLYRRTEDDKFRYLAGLFEEVYFKDISERYSIELPEVLGELTDDLCSSTGSLTNASKIAKTLQSVKGIRADSQTISRYLSFLTDSFLFRCSRRYDVKGKKYFEYPSKYYCTDVGLRNVRLNLRQQEETHIMENIIYNELVCRGYFVDVGVVELRETDEKGRQRRVTCEIDFVVNRGPKKYYIQSALHIDNESKAGAELRPLMSTGDFFKKIIITKTTSKSWFDENGIYHLGLYEFLLNEQALDF